MLFCCLWRNVDDSCHKHFVVVSRHQQTPPLTTSDKRHNLPRYGGTVLITPGRSQRWQHAMKPNTGGKSRFYLSYRHDVWYRKTRMVWLPDGEKSLKICLFVLTESTNVTDGQTHRRTPHDGIGRVYIASRGKNWPMSASPSGARQSVTSDNAVVDCTDDRYVVCQSTD